MTSGVTSAQKFNQARGALRFTNHVNMGDVYFANNANSNSSSGGGYTVDAPAATLMQSQSLCNTPTFLTTYSDTVFVGAGHAETITGAAGMTFSVPGVQYIGLGNGRLRPKITFNATASQILITGQGVAFSNMVFDFTGIDAIVAAIALSASDCTFDTCEFICQNATAGVVRGILTSATASRLTVKNCIFRGVQTSTGQTITACISHEVGSDFRFENNFFVGKMTQAILNASTILDGLILNNQFHIYTGTKGISLAAGTTGFGTGNKFVVASGTTPVVGAAFTFTGNNYATEALAVGTPTAAGF